jgi:chaperonin cofactor prefoldin
LVFDENLKYDKNTGVVNAQISEIVSVFKVIEKTSEDDSHYVEMGGLVYL